MLNGGVKMKSFFNMFFSLVIVFTTIYLASTPDTHSFSELNNLDVGVIVALTLSLFGFLISLPD